MIQLWIGAKEGESFVPVKNTTLILDVMHTFIFRPVRCVVDELARLQKKKKKI